MKGKTGKRILEYLGKIPLIFVPINHIIKRSGAKNILSHNLFS